MVTAKKISNFKYFAKQWIKSCWLCPSLIYSLSHESSFAVSNFTLNITCDPCKKNYIFKSGCVFSHCRPSYVVPTNLFQGIKAINPMFRGYAQQVGHPRWWNECAMFSLMQKTKQKHGDTCHTLSLFLEPNSVFESFICHKVGRWYDANLWRLCCTK